jgi:hypothetical protein
VTFSTRSSSKLPVMEISQNSRPSSREEQTFSPGMQAARDGGHRAVAYLIIDTMPEGTSSRLDTIKSILEEGVYVFIGTEQRLESLLSDEWGAGPPYYPSFIFDPDGTFRWTVPDRTTTECVEGRWKLVGTDVYVLLESSFRQSILKDEIEEEAVDSARWERIGKFSTYRP